MIVPVPVVQGVPVTVVHIVDVIAVQHALMPTVLTVPVLMPLVGDMPTRLALVPVSTVLTVQMPVVRVVDMVPVRHDSVPAVRAVRVGVGGVLQMQDGHGAHLRKYGR